MLPRRRQLIAHIRDVARRLSGLSFASENEQGDGYTIHLDTEGALHLEVSAGAGEATTVPLDTTLEQLPEMELAKLLEVCAEQGLPA